MLTPSEADFELLAGRDFDIIPVCREIPGDLETPVGAFLKIGRVDYAFLLERVRGELEELAKVEQHPKMEGRQMIMVIAPR